MGTDHGLGGSRGIGEFAAINWDAPLIIGWIDRDSARCYTDSIPSLHSNEFLRSPTLSGESCWDIFQISILRAKWQ